MSFDLWYSSRKSDKEVMSKQQQRTTTARRRLLQADVTEETTVQRLSRLQVTLKNALEQAKAFEIGGEVPARVVTILSKFKCYCN